MSCGDHLQIPLGSLRKDRHKRRPSRFLATLVGGTAGVLLLWHRPALSLVDCVDQPPNWLSQLTFVFPSKAMKWTINETTPFLVAACVMTMQSLLVFVTFIVTSSFWTGQSLSNSQRFTNTVKAYGFVSCFSAAFYWHLSTMPSTLVAKMPDDGDWIVSRSIHWHFTTPVQIFIFVSSCSPSRRDLPLLICLCLLMQFFGLLMLLIHPLEWQVLCFGLSCVSYALLIGRMTMLTLLPNVDPLGKVILWLYVGLWTLYPVSTVLRAVGWIDDWTEQVLIFTILDVISKSITFGGLLLIRFSLNLLSMQGSVQLARSSNDLVLTVDKSFQVLDSMRPAPLVNFYFGGALPNNSFIDLCKDETHRQTLRDVAYAADQQHLSTATPKCALTLKLPDKRQLGVQVFVSKLSRGQRILGIVIQDEYLTSQSEIGEEADGTIHLGTVDITPDFPKNVTVRSRSEASQPDSSLQLLMAIHNCTSVLGLTTQTKEMLTNVFLNQWNSCGLVFWDYSGSEPCISEEAEPNVVAMSPVLESLVGGSVETHARLSDIIDHIRVYQIMRAMTQKDLTLFQIRTRVGATSNCIVSMLPLIPFSKAKLAPAVNMCLMLVEIDLEQSVQHHVDTPLFWYRVGTGTVCVAASSPQTRILAPMTIHIPRPLCGCQAWTIFHEVNSDPTTPHAGGGELVDTTGGTTDSGGAEAKSASVSGSGSTIYTIDEGRVINNGEFCKMIFALPLMRRLVGYDSESTHSERVLLAAMGQGLPMCTRPVPKPFVELVEESCKA